MTLYIAPMLVRRLIPFPMPHVHVVPLAPHAVDPELTINEALVRWPDAVRALGALGIDTCCGGSSSLRDAAHDAGVPLATLLAAIAECDAVAR